MTPRHPFLPRVVAAAYLLAAVTVASLILGGIV